MAFFQSGDKEIVVDDDTVEPYESPLAHQKSYDDFSAVQEPKARQGRVSAAAMLPRYRPSHFSVFAWVVLRAAAPVADFATALTSFVLCGGREPWWPSVVFPDWEAVAKWEIPLPKTTSR
mgnify:CR=1 FL=1